MQWHYFILSNVSNCNFQVQYVLYIIREFTSVPREIPLLKLCALIDMRLTALQYIAHTRWALTKLTSNHAITSGPFAMNSLKV